MSSPTWRLATLASGVLAFFRVRKPSRQERRRAFQREIAADYMRAGADPEFHAAMREIEAEFDAARADGLDSAVPAR